MAPTLLCLRLLLALLTVVSLDFAQAGSDALYNPSSKVKDSLGSALDTSVEGGIGTYPYRYILNLAVIIYLYLERIVIMFTADSDQWTDWTSGDGTRDGEDADGILYIKPPINAYTEEYPDPNDRVGIFWAGGSTTEDDFGNVDEFIEFYTAEKGKLFTKVFDTGLFEKNMSLSATNKNNLWWRAINRASKSLAAYVFMNANNCRNLFSPPSQNPQDSDPDHGGQAINGEIWYYAELPMLMRNLNVNKIVTFYKSKRELGKPPPRFVQTTQWDVAIVSSLLHARLLRAFVLIRAQNTDKPRNFLPEIAMDAVPILLPQEAKRSPLKRDTLPSRGLSSIGYQKGVFEVKTTSISDLSAESATYTATSASALITTTVPIWSCSSCPAPYNAIFVSPVSVAGSAGIPSPLPGYKVEFRQSKLMWCKSLTSSSL